jgi:hypothetical protein
MAEYNKFWVLPPPEQKSSCDTSSDGAMIWKEKLARDAGREHQPLPKTIVMEIVTSGTLYRIVWKTVAQITLANPDRTNAYLKLYWDDQSRVHNIYKQ